MKNWLTIGQLAQKVGLSQKALRVYEKSGLLKAHARGENQYRYYSIAQVETVENIKLFRSFGFSLAEIRSLLEIDISFSPETLRFFLEKRLEELHAQRSEIESATVKIRNILSSLKLDNPGFAPEERRFIMSQLEKIAVVVTGVSGLEKTAQYIKEHFSKSGKNIPVIVWDGRSAIPAKKPYVLVIAENILKTVDHVASVSPDIVVIKDVSGFSADTHASYLKLYHEAGPHMSTILNADDRAVIELAGSDLIRKGRTYYFSKNSGLKPQIRKIGGVVSDGEKIEIYGMNQSPASVEVKMSQILGQSDEMAYLASLAAIMDLGLKKESLYVI